MDEMKGPYIIKQLRSKWLRGYFDGAFITVSRNSFFAGCDPSSMAGIVFGMGHFIGRTGICNIIAAAALMVGERRRFGPLA